MFDLDKQAPQMQPKKDPLTEQAERAQITGTRIAILGLIFSVIIGGVALYLAKKTYDLGIQTQNNTNELKRLDGIITSLSTGNSLTQSQNGKIDSELSDIKTQNGLINSGLSLSANQLKQLMLQNQSKRNQDLVHLFFSAQTLLSDVVYGNMLLDLKRPYSEKNLYLCQVDSVLKSEMSNSFLLSNDTLSAKWHQDLQETRFTIDDLKILEYGTSNTQSNLPHDSLLIQIENDKYNDLHRLNGAILRLGENVYSVIKKDSVGIRKIKPTNLFK